MTDSTPARATAVTRETNKRERLTGAAIRLLHERGIERTTLADIATLAGVPPGNVYYYFKTKDDVIAAVIDARAAQIRSTLASIDSRHRSPKSRLRAFVRELAARKETVAEHGCPLGSLCWELDKRAVPTSFDAAELMRLPIEWAETQFELMGRRDAHDLALDLIAGYEGSALLANTMRDPNVLAGAARRLGTWIDTL